MKNLLNQVESFLVFLDHQKGYSEHTIAAYRRDIKKMIQFIYDQASLQSFEEFTLPHFTSFTAKLKNDNLNANSIRRAIYAIKTFFIFLKNEKIVTVDRARYLEAPKIWKKVPEFLTYEEMLKLLIPPQDDADIFEMRNYAILEFLFATGVRVSELCDLRFKDLNFENNSILIRGKGNKERVVICHNTAINALLNYLELRYPYYGRYDYVFASRSNKRLDRIAVFRMIKNKLEQTDIFKNVSPHTFRHSFATALFNNEADIRVVQELLGHSSITNTSIYLHTSLKNVQKKFDITSALIVSSRVAAEKKPEDKRARRLLNA